MYRLVFDGAVRFIREREFYYLEGAEGLGTFCEWYKFRREWGFCEVVLRGFFELV